MEQQLAKLLMEETPKLDMEQQLAKLLMEETPRPDMEQEQAEQLDILSKEDIPNKEDLFKVATPNKEATPNRADTLLLLLEQEECKGAVTLLRLPSSLEAETKAGAHQLPAMGPTTDTVEIGNNDFIIW